MSKNGKKAVYGIILIVIAALLVMKGINPGFLNNAFGQLGVWEIVWTVILGLILLNGILEKNLFTIIGSIAFLVFIYEGKYGIPNIPAWSIFVPAALIYLGIQAMVPRRWHFYRNTENGAFRAEYNSKKNDDCEESEAVIDCDGSNIEVTFGSTVKYFEDDEFTNSNLEVNFGSIKAYYNKVKMKGNVAYINAEENFGSIEIFIPKTWKCEVHKEQAFGGIPERGNVEWDGEHTVYINAEANFGEIVIHHV
ncbi:MAG: hypothetical protein K6F63_07650 [Lachnospiraceae bacterium]|nr:hypothetical protein [Lachnospiraceae bacterium]